MNFQFFYIRFEFFTPTKWIVSLTRFGKRNSELQPGNNNADEELTNTCSTQYEETEVSNDTICPDSLCRKREYQYQMTIKYQNKLLKTYHEKQIELQKRNNALPDMINLL